jgi:hypothetical protein
MTVARIVRCGDVSSGSQAALRFGQPHASFAFTNRHSPEQQVAALGPMLSTWDRFRFLIQGWSGSQALNSRRHEPSSRNLKSFFCKNQKIAFWDRIFL